MRSTSCATVTWRGMTNLKRQAALRFYLRHPGQLLLAVAGVALGVAVVLAVDLASDSALRAFKLSQALTASRASHNLESAIGDLPEKIYPQLKVALGIDLAAPIVAGRVFVDEQLQISVSLLGVDPLAELAFDDGVRLAGRAARGSAADVTRLITQPGAVLVPETLAQRLGVGEDDALTVLARGERRQLQVAGVVALAAGGSESGPLIADIATAQELLELAGRLTRIELALTADEAGRVSAVLPPGITLAPVESSDAVTRDMLRAFRINLTALGFLALAVGMLLIYATMSFAIVQRRESLGTLRALGVTRREIAADVLAESAILGSLATGLGLLLGLALAQFLIDLVLRAINDLYFSTNVTPEGLPPLPFFKAGLLGLGATMAAALRPAIDAAREPPRVAMSRIGYEQIMARRFRATPLMACACLLLATLLIGLPGEGLYAAFAGLFFMWAGYALLIPAATAWLMRGLGRGGRLISGLPARLAVRGAAASLSRTGVAVTALAVAIAHVVGIGVMIDSFRGSVIHWLDRSMLADYYLVTREDVGTGFSSAEMAELRALAGVTGLSRSRTTTLKTAAGELAIRVAGAGPRGYGEELISGEADAVFAALDRQRAVLVTEPHARRNALSVGDTLTLPSPAGDLEFRVVGIFRDYRTSDSALLISYDVFSEIWGDQAPTGVGVYVAENADRDALGTALDSFARRRGATRVAPNAEIRRATLEIFDRTFAITSVLRWLAGLVAFFGILSALLALQLERSREVATLRAIGFTRTQAGGNALVQTTLLGLVSGLFALPLGVVLAALLIYVINQRSFGWSMGFVVEPRQLVTGVALAVLAAFLAGLYPARRLAAQPIARGLRGE